MNTAASSLKSCIWGGPLIQTSHLRWKASQRDTHRNTGRNEVKMGNLIHATIQRSKLQIYPCCNTYGFNICILWKLYHGTTVLENTHETGKSMPLFHIRRICIQKVEKYIWHPSRPSSSPKYFTRILALHVEVFKA
jgi:hypothetical protein